MNQAKVLLDRAAMAASGMGEPAMATAQGQPQAAQMAQGAPSEPQPTGQVPGALPGSGPQ